MRGTVQKAIAHVGQVRSSRTSAAARLERGETFDPAPREPVSPSICQVFVKSEADRAGDERTDHMRETNTNANDDQDLADWLGGRDSNPDNMVRSRRSGLPDNGRHPSNVWINCKCLASGRRCANPAIKRSSAVSISASSRTASARYRQS
jgi:hypothetical protein